MALRLASDMSEHSLALSLSEQVTGYTQRRLDAVAFVQDSLAKIAEKNPRSNYFVHVDPDAAVQQAEASADRWRRGRPKSRLDGLTFAIKDNMVRAGMPTCAGSATPLSLPNTQAPVVGRLMRAGMILLGKLNMDECALGVSTENPWWGHALNPLDNERSPGGSSGGSAAAVASGLCGIAFGTDTMGSIRIPAAYCGVWGLKPSWSAADLRGVVPLCRSLDTVGPIARSLDDLRLVFEAITTQTIPETGRQRIRVGVVAMPPEFGLDAAHLVALESLSTRLTQNGHTVTTFTPSEWTPERDRRHALLLTVVGGATTWQDLAGAPITALSPATRSAFAHGAGSSDEKRAEAARRQKALRAAATHWFKEVDVLLMPVAPSVAPLKADAINPLVAQACCLANLTGCPALAMPLTNPTGGMPVSFQLMAARGRDAALLSIAKQWRDEGVIY